MLGPEDAARSALQIGERLAISLSREPASARRTDQVRVLAQGLSYALSVLVARLPDEGFAMLGRIVAIQDPLLDKVVRGNLSKKRIARPFPDRVAALRAILDARD
jgi:hypothetical protein